MTSRLDQLTDFDRAAFKELAQKMIALRRSDSGLSPLAQAILHDVLMSFCRQTGASPGGITEQIQAPQLRALGRVFSAWLAGLDAGTYAPAFCLRDGSDAFIRIKELHAYCHVNKLFLQNNLDLTQTELKRLLLVLGLVVDRPTEKIINGRRHRSLICLDLMRLQRFVHAQFDDVPDLNLG